MALRVSQPMPWRARTGSKGSERVLFYKRGGGGLVGVVWGAERAGDVEEGEEGRVG